MLFAAVLMNIPNSNVCPRHCVTESENSTVIMHLISNVSVFVIFNSNVFNFMTNNYGQIIQKHNS